MERTYKFKVGQNVKIFDEDYAEMVYGKVVDTTSDCVFIQWEDLSEPCQHYESEYHKIKLSNHIHK